MIQGDWHNKLDKPAHIGSEVEGEVVLTLCGLHLLKAGHQGVGNYNYATFMTELRSKPYSEHPCCPDCLRNI